MLKNIHIINAHQRWEGIADGKLNQHFIDTIDKTLTKHNINHTITTIDINYDIDYEVDRLINADLIIFQFPMYWMSAPWLAKKYIDEVFMRGYSKIYRSDGRDIEGGLYGTGGMLNNKYMLSITANAPSQAFTDPTQFFHGLGVDDAFIAIHNSFKFVGCKQLPTFIAHDVIKQPQIAQDTQRLVNHIEQIIANN